jgi:1,4-dihydroxy-2-naphthoyl-CoA hydrolase
MRALPRGGARRRGAGDQALRRRRRAGASLTTPERFQERLEGSFPGALGIEVIRVDPDEVEGRLVIDERHLHPGGYVHGGVFVAFADSVAAWGTYRNLPDGHDFTTAELKANVFAAGHPGDVLHAIGRPLHLGRRTQVWEVRIRRNDDQRNAAFFTCTQMVSATGPA